MIWKCKNKNIEYGSKTLVMGIVNVTPDSFSDGGCWNDDEKAVQHALQLVDEGADIIDFGAQSTRPNYTEISPQEEWERLKGVISRFTSQCSVPVSVDTYFPYVAEKAIQSGADIINDISGNVTEEMAKIVKSTNCGWIIMHNGNGGSEDVAKFFKDAVKDCQNLGVNTEQICLDMGIGFGKDYEQNLDLIANIKSYKIQGLPLLLGTSRKRVIGTSSNQPNPQERVYGNISADTVAILGGADIIRIHDVKNEIQGILTAQELKKWTK